jgi:hypothetical protein
MIAGFIYSSLGGIIKNRRTLAAIYKTVCIILSAALCGLLVWYALRDGRGQIGLAMLAAAVFAALVYVTLTKKTSTLHAFPSSLHSFNTYGGRKEIIDSTGAHVMHVVFDNGCEVQLDFCDGVYTATLKNDEWDSVESEETDEEDALTEIMEELCEKATEYVPGDPYECSDESVPEDQSDDDDSDDSDDDDGDGDGYVYTFPGDDGAVL